MLLADLVATSEAVAATKARSSKVADLAAFVARLEPDEIEAGVAFLSGQTRQGRVGVGWATIAHRPRPPAAPAPSITIGELHHTIDELAAISGAGSATTRHAVLERLFARATEREADFIARLLLGELRQGALEGIMLDAIAKATAIAPAVVRRAAMLAGDVPSVAAVARREGELGLAAIGLEPLRPVQPMLASTAASVADALASLGRSSIEWKLDGARVQAHLGAGTVRLFTRNLNDVTARLPGIAELVRALPCSSVVLDGEVIGMGVDDDRPDPFQDTMSRFGRHEAEPAGLVVRFFDCLHIDGRDLIDAPLHERVAVLEQRAPEYRIPGIITADLAEAEAFQDAALASGHEGVMVKAVDSAYEAGRRGGAWRKVKPVITVDLVVLGVEWGSGRRQGWLSNLHLGARDAASGEFVMVGKTFKGLTDELLQWQTERLLALERERRGHVVLVRPELVVEIAIDGVQSSTRYGGGVTLRFARVKQYRPDKRPADADTIESLRALLRG